MDDPGFSRPELLEQEPAPRKTPRPLVIGVATALVIGAGVSVAAAATSSAGSPTPSTAPTPTVTATATVTPTPEEKPDVVRVWPGWRHGGMFGGGIHGEFVVPKDGGGFQTIATQHGEVTAVDGDSITVKSEDGFSKTYAVNDQTRVHAGREGISAVESGDMVSVTATVEGETATATMVVDMTRPAWVRPHRGGGDKFLWVPRPSKAPVEPSAPGTPTG